jgi:hypothetical protein
MSDGSNIGQIRRRRDGIREWLDEEAPLTAVEQKHLDEGSPERAYWHHGYQAALTDVMDMLTSADQIYDSVGIPN